MRDDFAVYYAINNDPRYVYFLKNSIDSLRRFNKDIKVYVFIYGPIDKDYLRFFSRNGADVFKRKTLSKEHNHFTKWWALRELKEKRLLFIDADTIFYKDVAIFFKKFQKKDFYARREVATCKRKYKMGDVTITTQIDHKMFSAISKKLKARKLPIFNTGVMLFNNRLHKRIPYELFLSFYNLFKKGGLQYPSFNPTIMDEVLTSLVLGKLKSFRFGLFDAATTPWFEEIKFKERKDPGIVLHIWSACYEDYLLYSQIERK